MNEKSPDAFRTISEVADELDLPQHVLRFWETKFSAIRPMKRGGGRRYYRPSDITLLMGIRHLLYSEGYTIKGVQKILKDQGNRFVMDLASDVQRGVTLSLTPDEPERPQAEHDAAQGDDIVLAPRLRGGGRGPELTAAGPASVDGDAVRKLKQLAAELKDSRNLLQRAREG